MRYARKISRQTTPTGGNQTGYQCVCKAKNWFPPYAVAQMAMGNDLIHHCECGRMNEVTASGVILGPAPVAAD